MLTAHTTHAVGNKSVMMQALGFIATRPLGLTCL